MKKILFTIGLIVIFAACASAQVSKPFAAYVGGGISLPNGDFGDLYKNGYHGLAGVGFNVAPMMQLMAKGEYHMFSPDGDVDGGDFKWLMVGADLRFSPSMPMAPIKPFGIAGLGFANLNVSDMNTPLLGTVSFESQTDLYYELGAGVEFAAGPSMSFFAMARYVNVNTDGNASKYIPVTVGLKF